MSKLISDVDVIRKRVRLGYPSGVDEQSIRDIPLLLARIDELEKALQPFARAGVVPSGLELVHVYYRDCANAVAVLTDNPPPRAYEIPAE